MGLVTLVEENHGRGHQLYTVCQRSHFLQSCPVFSDMPVQARTLRVRDEKRCYACLGKGHRMAECRRRKLCGVVGCTYYHSDLLHFPMRNPLGPNRPMEDETLPNASGNNERGLKRPVTNQIIVKRPNHIATNDKKAVSAQLQPSHSQMAEE